MELGGPALVEGAGNSARFASGATAQVDGATVGILGNFTAMAWVQLDGISGFQTIIAKGDSPNFAVINSDSNLVWFVDGAPGLTTDSQVLTAGEVAHVAVA